MTGGTGNLASFDLPLPAAEAALGVLRLGNTLLDWLFYDVDVLRADLRARGERVTTGLAPHPVGDSYATSLQRLDLGALASPEGSLLAIDTATPPYVTRYAGVEDFLAAARGPGARIRAVAISGVGSSALGAAAFGWNVSAALGCPVVAVVPGYGVADALQQALGGWFGFGVYDWVQATAQQVLAGTAPALARAGRALLESVPGHAQHPLTGAPVFRHGDAASDVLHALLERMADISLLVGHSKGALAIGNAILSLPPATTRRLTVITYGCPISEAVPAARYVQFLGRYDPIGQLNAWGHRAEVLLDTDHSTNTVLPFSMAVTPLTGAALRDAPAQAAAVPVPACAGPNLSRRP